MSIRDIIILLIGILGSWLFFVLPMELSLLIKCLILAIIVMAACICILIMIIYTQKQKMVTMPNAIGTISDRNKSILLVTHTEILSINAAVCVFYQDGQYERLVMLGKVLNIQNKNKIIQIELLKDIEGNKEIIDNIKLSKKDTIEKLIIKPNIQIDALGGFYGEN